MSTALLKLNYSLWVNTFKQQQYDSTPCRNPPAGRCWNYTLL